MPRYRSRSASWTRRSCGRRVVARPRCVRNAIIEFRTPQTDAVSRTRHLQRADCHADRLGDLLTAHSALNQIPDLLEPFRRGFDQPSVSSHQPGPTARADVMAITKWSIVQKKP